MKKKNLLLTFLLAALAFGGVELYAQKTLPYSYGFENNNLAGEGWTISTGSNGTIYKGNNPRNGDYHFRFRSTGTADTYQYLFSPELPSSVGINVQFYYFRTGTTNMTFNVGYSTTNTDPESFTFLETDITVSNLSYNDNIYFSHDFNVANIKYIAIKYTNFTGTWVYLYIDDITISELSSSCTTPTDLSAEATSSTTANISWTAGGNETAWQLYYSNVNYATPNNAAPTDFITINTTPSYTITGLDPNTEYFVYVRAKCDEDNNSDWTDAVSFKTSYVQAIPYSYGFETSSELNHWTAINTTGIIDENPHDGTYSFKLYSTSSTQYLITPELSGTSNGLYISLYYKCSVPGKKLQIGYSTTDRLVESSFTWGDELNSTASAPKYYELYCPVNTKYIALKSEGNYTAVWVDDIMLFIPTATTDGNWNNAATWATGAVPSSSANVVISSDVTIPNGYTATANNITIDGGSLTIEDGGNLICNNNVNATISRTITPFSSANDKGHWYLIASPMTDEYLVSESGLTSTTPSNYDLYIFDQYYEGQEWRNYKGTGEGHFTHIKNKVGYLYASAENTSVSFTGTLNNTDGNINLTKIDGKDLSGMNLIGNPYPCQTGIGKSFYRIVDNDGVSELISYPAGTLINPMEGIVVEAATNGETVAFTKAASGGSKGAISLNLGKNNSTLDRAIVSFDEDGELTKFMLNPDNTKIYIPGEEKDYAVVSANAEGEMPVNFKANADGQYTISVNTEDVEMSYLHLIDNLTGADIDLMANPSYTFNANASDYASRFRIVFSGNGIEENLNESDNFAFIGSNGQLIVNGTGTIQIIDIMGRVISTRSTEEHINTNNMTAGVYVLQLTTGSETKTQKIIVK
ncbi:MAG: T9SS type A sorting domain-containing protein [Bacteroidales bacterium]|nr:T9SS type A sorting domain-containing protein [Bacteroidales bacterium]